MGTRDLRTLWHPPVSLNQVGHTHRCKTTIFIFFTLFFVTRICWKVPHENIHGEANFYVLHNAHLCVRPHTRRRDRWLDLVFVETTPKKASPPEKGEKKKKTSRKGSIDDHNLGRRKKKKKKKTIFVCRSWSLNPTDRTSNFKTSTDERTRQLIYKMG